LIDEDFKEEPAGKEQAFGEARRTLKSIQETIFPLFNIYAAGLWM